MDELLHSNTSKKSRSKSFLCQNLMSSVISVSTQQRVHPKSELLSQTKSMFKLVGMLHCVKSAYIQSFSGTYFPVFGLNTVQKKSGYRHFTQCYFRGYEYLPKFIYQIFLNLKIKLNEKLLTITLN